MPWQPAFSTANLAKKTPKVRILAHRLWRWPKQRRRLFRRTWSSPQPSTESTETTCRSNRRYCTVLRNFENSQPLTGDGELKKVKKQRVPCSESGLERRMGSCGGLSRPGGGKSVEELEKLRWAWESGSQKGQWGACLTDHLICFPYFFFLTTWPMARIATDLAHAIRSYFFIFLTRS